MTDAILNNLGAFSLPMRGIITVYTRFLQIHMLIWGDQGSHRLKRSKADYKACHS